jgi:hypothetical protein
MMQNKTSAVVLLGGFLSQATIYSGFSQRLEALTGRRVYVVNTHILDWAHSITKFGWLLVLNKLEITVKRALSKNPGKKVTLIGHSQGGILGRFYLSDKTLLGKSFCGREYIDHLITLGSPHFNQGGVQRGGSMAQWVQQYVPDSTFTPQVRYTSVCGKYVKGRTSGTLSERMAYRVYKDICGDGNVWGDGMVPVSSALLPGSQEITLLGVSHYAIIGRPWYGSDSVIQEWWQ